MSATRPIATRTTWLAECIELLKAEKELTRRNNELARRRQTLPQARVDEGYRFEAENGSASLADPFDDHSQLLVYHFTFGPDYKADCPSRSAIADGFNGLVTYLTNHDVTLAAVSRGPLAKLLEYRKRMSWSFPWISLVGSDFNYDFNVSITEDQQRTGNVNCGYVHGSHVMDASDLPEPVQQFVSVCSTDVPAYARDRPGVGAFMPEDGVMHHTYPTYARGLDGLWGAYQWLGRASLGRNEACVWRRHHDGYAQQR